MVGRNKERTWSWENKGNWEIQEKWGIILLLQYACKGVCWYGVVYVEVNATAEQKSKILQKKKGGICQIESSPFLFLPLFSFR